MVEIDVKGLKKIAVNSNLIEADFDDKTKTLVLTTRLNPEIIDSNFKELVDRLGMLERSLQSVDLQMRKIENNVNLLNALKQKMV